VQAAFIESDARAKEATEAERPFKQAQDELNAALADLKAQEDSYENQKNDLTQRSQTGGNVSRNKAKAELEILLREDPLPLRRAKLNTEAAERRADKARAPFKAAKEIADAALAEAQRQLQEAIDYLNEVKSKPDNHMDRCGGSIEN